MDREEVIAMLEEIFMFADYDLYKCIFVNEEVEGQKDELVEITYKHLNHHRMI